MLLEEESQALELLQAFVEKPVHLEVEPSYTQEQFDVILASPVLDEPEIKRVL